MASEPLWLIDAWFLSQSHSQSMSGFLSPCVWSWEKQGHQRMAGPIGLPRANRKGWTLSDWALYWSFGAESKALKLLETMSLELNSHNSFGYPNQWWLVLKKNLGFSSLRDLPLGIKRYLRGEV